MLGVLIVNDMCTTPSGITLLLYLLYFDLCCRPSFSMCALHENMYVCKCLSFFELAVTTCMCSLHRISHITCDVVTVIRRLDVF